MRRAAAVVAVTVIGLWLVLSFKSSPLPGAILARTPRHTTAPPPPGNNGGQPPAGATAEPAVDDHHRRPPTSGRRTVDGNVVSTRYGDVQVAVVVQGSRILDVKPLQLPFDRPRSQSISNQAAPLLLRREVLQAQSAQIDTIGGATYTSDGYAQSLQSALDKAHA